MSDGTTRPPPTLPLAAAGDSRVSRYRPGNEDCVVVDGEARLYAVIDGVGGREAGEVAAALVAEALRHGCVGPAAAETLRAALVAADERVRQESVRRGLARPMAAAVTAVWIDASADSAVVAHVGDTRAYYFTPGGNGIQVTRDGSSEDLDRLAEHDAMRSGVRHILRDAVGVEHPDADWVQLLDLRLEPGATLVLVTDGVSDYVDRARVCRLAASGPPDQAVAALLDAAEGEQDARRRGDNVSAVVVQLQPRDQRPFVACPEAATVAPLVPQPTLGAPAAPRTGALRSLPLAVAAVATVAAVLAVAALPRKPAPPLATAPPRQAEVSGELSAEGELTVHPGGRLLLDGVTWRDPEARLDVRLSSGSELVVVRSRIEVARFHVFAEAGATMRVDASTIMTSTSESQLEVSPESVVTLDRAVFDLPAAGSLGLGMEGGVASSALLARNVIVIRGEDDASVVDRLDGQLVTFTEESR